MFAQTTVVSPPPRKQSLASITSPALSMRNLPALNERSHAAARKASIVSVASSSIRVEDSSVDPEGLFVKHTVAEVRAIQRKLQGDADAKQGELRLMVGERYRELLQASTSIISMASSSEHILNVLEDMQEVAEDTEPEHRVLRTTLSQKDDGHLKAMQSLTAHIRLLLDTPEHLWRLLEQKKFLHASWLFLLARVVHRSLANNDADDDDGLHSQGLDVLEQFPIAQRQWDTIAPFRSQITHKATLSLRETGHPANEICATLLTLHLIDSKPLSETLSTFTAQRSRSLKQAISRTLELTPSTKNSTAGPTTKSQRKAQAHAVRLAINGVLNIVSSTVGTARTVFQSQPDSSAGLMRDTLEFIETDGKSRTASGLPESLRLSTNRLLGKMSSSTHAPLPPTIKSYKPYIDLSSSSTVVTSDNLNAKLDQWFSVSLQQLITTLQGWIASLQSARQVWLILSWFRAHVASSTHLQEAEKAQLASVMEKVCQERIVQIWTTALRDMRDTFTNKLETSLASLASSNEPKKAWADYHFFCDLPALESAGLSISATSFEGYRESLQKQLNGRTPTLDELLSPMEARVQRIVNDVARMRQDGDDVQTIVNELTRMYEMELAVLQDDIMATVNSEADIIMAATATESCIRQISFFIRLLEELGSWSDCGLINKADGNSVNGFTSSARTLGERMLDTWCQSVVTQTTAGYWDALKIECAGRSLFGKPDADLTNVSGALLSTLVSLATFVHDIRPVATPAACEASIVKLLPLFIGELVSEPDGEFANSHYARDLQLLRQIAALWAEPLSESVAALDNKIKSLPGKLKPDEAGSDIGRFRLMLDALLPSGMGQGKIPHDAPASSERQTPSVIDAVKPSPRFGLLFVGTVIS